MSRVTYAHTLCNLSVVTAEARDASGRCTATGLDPSAYRGIVGAAVILRDGKATPAAALKIMRDTAGRHPWLTDSSLIEWLADFETRLKSALREINAYYETVLEDLTRGKEMARSRHPQVAAEGKRIITDCLAAMGLLDIAALRLKMALARLSTVPAELGETYEAAYNTIRAGHVLPFDGRWVTGQVGATGP